MIFLLALTAVPAFFVGLGLRIIADDLRRRRRREPPRMIALRPGRSR